MSASDAGDAPVTVPATRSASCGLMCVCAACGREFSCQNRLLFHMHEMHGEPVFPCTEAGCCKAFKRRDLLDRHVRDVHMGIRSFRCTVPGCTAAYFTHTNLLKHMKSHQRQFACTFPGCSEVFRKKTQLRAHMSAVHTGDPSKPYACTQCSRCFAFPGQLALHERMHAAVDHVCGFDGCGFVARSLEELRQHVVAAHSTVPLPPTVPPVDQPSSSAASAGDPPQQQQQQQQQHSGSTADQRVACTVCGKELHPKSLAKHMQTHQTDAPMFACTVPGCTKVYCSRQSLRAHFNASHSDHRFKCPHCPATFAYKVSLVQHIAHTHAATTSSTTTTSTSTSTSTSTRATAEDLAAPLAVVDSNSAPADACAAPAAPGVPVAGLVRSLSTSTVLPRPAKRLCRLAGLDPDAAALDLLPITPEPPPPVVLPAFPLPSPPLPVAPAAADVSEAPPGGGGEAAEQ